MYVKAIGRSAQFTKQGNQFLIERITPVENYNEVTGHFLQIFLFSEMRSKGMMVEEHKGFVRVKFALLTLLICPL